MVGTPERRQSTRHRRSASILALRAIRSISPVAAADRKAERRRLERDRRYRARLGILREMREVLGLPQLRRNRRPPVPRRVDPNLIVLVSSDTSVEDIRHPIPECPPVIDLDSSLETLPDIDPRPQFQLPLQQPHESLEDLGDLNITAEFLPPIRHKVFREAVVLLERILPQPMPEVDWGIIACALFSITEREHAARHNHIN